MKKSLFPILAIAFVAVSCNNKNQNLNADVEIPVSVQDATLKSIEEYVSTSGTAYPIGEILIKSEITANYFLEKNPRTGKAWQLNDKVISGDLIARLEDQQYINDIKTAEINKANAKTALVSANLSMAKTRIIAPIDGVIVELPYYTQGIRVNTGSDIVEIMDYKMMYMNVQLPEKYVSVIKPEEVVKLTNYTL